MSQKNRNPKGLLYAVLGLVVIGLAVTFMFRNSDQGGVTPSTSIESPAAQASPEASASASPEAMASAQPAQKEPNLTPDEKGLSQATVTIQTPKGVIKYRFYTKDAPKTVQRMVELIRSGFYNGLTFHRVEPGFVIQGGDPDGNGTGGSGQKLKAEFNSRKHIVGAVAMARAMDPDSADSQFYISLGTHPHLDNNYTVFGQVTEGFDVIRKIEPGDRMTSVTVE